MEALSILYYGDFVRLCRASLNCFIGYTDKPIVASALITPIGFTITHIPTKLYQFLFFARAVYPTANPSVCFSVHPSVRHTPVLCQNEGTQTDAVFTIW